MYHEITRRHGELQPHDLARQLIAQHWGKFRNRWRRPKVRPPGQNVRAWDADIGFDLGIEDDGGLQSLRGLESL